MKINHAAELLRLGRYSVTQIAEMSGFSDSGFFSRQFKNTCGFSPYEYLILTRLNRAKHLLVSSAKPIKVIAQEVGYGSESAFTNAFSSRVGVSPGQFRKYPV